MTRPSEGRHPCRAFLSSPGGVRRLPASAPPPPQSAHRTCPSGPGEKQHVRFLSISAIWWIMHCELLWHPDVGLLFNTYWT